MTTVAKEIQPSEATFRIGVGAIICQGDKILLGLRGSKARDNHIKWELLGGLLEYGESPDEAIKREVREEAGIDVEPLVIIGSNNKIVEESREQWVGFTFECKYLKGTPHRTDFDRVIDFQWLTSAEAFR